MKLKRKKLIIIKKELGQLDQHVKPWPKSWNRDNPIKKIDVEWFVTQVTGMR